MNAIEIKGLCKQYPGFCLDHLDLTLPGGCIMGLVGENGAGKSTTIKLMLDMVRRDAGSITLLGRDSAREIRLLKEEIGVVPDEIGVPSCLTARQVGRVMQGVFARWDAAAYEQQLRALGVPEDKQFKDFSRGTRMKLGIAIALSHHAKLLLLDEATSGLDPVVRDEVLDVFSEFTRDEEHAILISSHIVSDLEKLCDYIAFLHSGRLLLCEEKDRLKEEYAIVRGTAEQLARLPAGSIRGRRESPYGAEALVRREDVPAGMPAGMVDIEQLFIFLAKEAV